MTKQTTSVLTLARSHVGSFKVPTPPVTPPPTGRWSRFLPAIGGIGYGVAWVTGLIVWPSNLSIGASDRGVVSLYAAHVGQATAQYLLVEALAGICLGLVLFAGLRLAGVAGVHWGIAAVASGGVAVVLSLTQALLGVFLVSSASHGAAGQSGDLYAVINRLDGVKQLLLGAAIVMLVNIRGAEHKFPVWISRVTIVAGIALVPSGLAYVFLWSNLAGTTFISLPLLVVWTAGTGLWVTRRIH
jgi:hypothetical protein